MASPRNDGESAACALYLHVPFCRTRCAYCDFATAATPANDARMGAYLGAVTALVDAVAEAGLLAGVRSAYVGGGTPTFAPRAHLAALLDATCAHAPRLSELTVEANPDSLDAATLALLAERGATRVSVGVQSLADAELRALGRVHDASGARRALADAVASGLAVSADVMCATPLQSDATLAMTLATIAELGVRHVSVYPLTIEDGTPLARRVAASAAGAPWNDPDLAADRMQLAAQTLASYGLSRYEVASYAAAGAACAHNIAYWTGVPYLGIGTSAASMLGAAAYDALRAELAPQLPERPQAAWRARLVTRSTTSRLTDAASWSRLGFDVEFLTHRQALAEDLMLAMRMSAGADAGLLGRARAVMGTSLDEAVAHVVARGLARRSAARLVPTERGWLLGNELYGAMWDLAEGPTTELRC